MEHSLLHIDVHCFEQEHTLQSYNHCSASQGLYGINVNFTMEGTVLLL